jgi:hypothetical protein
MLEGGHPHLAGEIFHGVSFMNPASLDRSVRVQVASVFNGAEATTRTALIQEIASGLIPDDGGQGSSIVPTIGDAPIGLRQLWG